MATYVRRTVTNTGQPFTTPDGSALVGVLIKFTLVNAKGQPTSAIDATTLEHVGGSAEAVTDSTGVFSIDLWPSDQGHIPTGYLVEYQAGGFKKFIAGLPTGGGSITITALETQSATLVGQELNSLAVHASDNDIHWQEPASDGIYYVRRNGIWTDASAFFVPASVGAQVIKAKITAITDDYLVCTEADGAVSTFNVAKPEGLSMSYTAHDGLTFTYTNANTRTADDGATTEEQSLVPPYVVNDLIAIASPMQNDPRSYTISAVSVDATDMWHDLNITGRQWAKTV